MKIWPFIFVFLCMSYGAYGEQAFVHSPDLEEAKFQSLLTASRGRSLTQVFQKKERIQDLNTLVISENEDQIRAQISQMELLPLLATEVEVLTSLFEKIRFNALTREEKDRALGILLSNEWLQPQHADFYQKLKRGRNGEIPFYARSETKKLSQWLTSEKDILFIDGEKWTNEKKISRLPHQWLLVSNAWYPVLATGLIEDFTEALELRTSFSSDCQNGEILWKNIPQLKVTNIGGHTECPLEEEIASSLQNPTFKTTSSQTSIKKEHDSLWIASLALVSGAIAANSLRQRQYMFHWPSLKF